MDGFAHVFILSGLVFFALGFFLFLKKEDAQASMVRGHVQTYITEFQELRKQYAQAQVSLRLNEKIHTELIERVKSLENRLSKVTSIATRRVEHTFPKGITVQTHELPKAVKAKPQATIQAVKFKKQLEENASLLKDL